MSSTDREPSPRAGAGRRSAEATAGPGQAGRRKRVRHWTADDRAAHRAFERSRREAFKERLTRLAGEIPSLQSTDPNRLSKHVVLDESVSLHRAQQSQIATSRHQFDTLLAERDELLAEVNRWRTGAGLDTRGPTWHPSDGAPTAEGGRPDPFTGGQLDGDFSTRPPNASRTTSETIGMSLASLGPDARALADPGQALMASDEAAVWEDLAMNLPLGDPPLDLDGMDVGALVPGPYELPLLRHDANHDYGMPFQQHPPQILDPSEFLQHHIHNA